MTALVANWLEYGMSEVENMTEKAHFGKEPGITRPDNLNQPYLAVMEDRVHSVRW